MLVSCCHINVGSFLQDIVVSAIMAWCYYFLRECIWRIAFLDNMKCKILSTCWIVAHVHIQSCVYTCLSKPVMMLFNLTYVFQSATYSASPSLPGFWTPLNSAGWWPSFRQAVGRSLKEGGGGGVFHCFRVKMKKIAVFCIPFISVLIKVHALGPRRCQK